MLFLSFFPLFNFKTYKDIVSVIFNLLLFCLLPCIHPLIAIVHIHVHVQVKTRYTIVSCMYIYFKHVAHITVIDTLMIQNYIVHSTLFLHRVLPATDESIRQLTGLKGTPLAYLLSPGLPVEDTVLGPVQLGSLLPHHVSMALSFNSSSFLNNNNNEILIKREPQVYTTARCAVYNNKKWLGQYNSNNKLIHGQYTSRYKLHTHTHTHTTPHHTASQMR